MKSGADSFRQMHPEKGAGIIMSENTKKTGKSNTSMSTKKMALCAVFIACAVVGSMFSIPVLGSRCSPVQHLVNILCAVFLGPWYGLAAAFLASLLRNMLGLGTLLAFPGSMCGALLSGLLYRWLKKLPAAWLGELFGTSIIGGLLAYPVAAFIMGNSAAALFAYIIPFMISSGGGTIIAAIVTAALKKSGFLANAQAQMNA